MSVQAGPFVEAFALLLSRRTKKEVHCEHRISGKADIYVENSIQSGFLHIPDSTAMSLLSYHVNSVQNNKGPSQAFH